MRCAHIWPPAFRTNMHYFLHLSLSLSLFSTSFAFLFTDMIDTLLSPLPTAITGWATQHLLIPLLSLRCWCTHTRAHRSLISIATFFFSKSSFSPVIHGAALSGASVCRVSQPFAHTPLTLGSPLFFYLCLSVLFIPLSFRTFDPAYLETARSVPFSGTIGDA